MYIAIVACVELMVFKALDYHPPYDFTPNLSYVEILMAMSIILIIGIIWRDVSSILSSRTAASLSEPSKTSGPARVILRTNNFNEPAKNVWLLKSPISDTNSQHKVLHQGEVFITGGIIIPATETTLEVLNKLTPKQQWDWLKGLRQRIIVEEK